MGIRFDENNEDCYSINGSGIRIDEPYTMAAWVKLTAGLSFVGAILTQLSTLTPSTYNIWRVSQTPTPPATATGIYSGANIQIEGVQGWSLSRIPATSGDIYGTWYHHAGTFETTLRKSYINGFYNEFYTDGAPTNDITRTVYQYNQMNIGKWKLVPDSYDMHGVIAHLTIWDTILSDSEIEGLSNGANPLTVRPSNIVSYWPMHGDGPSNVRTRDLIGQRNMPVASGSPTKADSIKLRNNMVL